MKCVSRRDEASSLCDKYIFIHRLTLKNRTHTDNRNTINVEISKRCLVIQCLAVTKLRNHALVTRSQFRNSAAF